MNFASKLYFFFSKKDYCVVFDKEGAPCVTYRSGECYLIPSFRPTFGRLEIGKRNICRKSDILNIYRGISTPESGLTISREKIVQDLIDYCKNYHIEVVDTGVEWIKQPARSV